MDKSETSAPDSAAAAPESQPAALDDTQLDGVTGGVAALNTPALPGQGGPAPSTTTDYAHS